MQTRESVMKDKTTAILLAIFFGFWSYLYTYEKDKLKFWLGFGLSFVTLGLAGIVFWIMAIVDSANRDANFYNNFLNDTNFNSNEKLDSIDNLFLIEDKVVNLKIVKCISNIRKYKEYSAFVPFLAVWLPVFMIWFVLALFIVNGPLYRYIWYGNHDGDIMATIIIIFGILVGILMASFLYHKYRESKNKIYQIKLNIYLAELESYNKKVFNDFGGKEKIIEHL